MSFVSPVRRSVHTCGGKGSLDSQLVFSALDIVRYSFQVVIALDIVQCVSCFFQKSFVYDQSVGFDNISDSSHRVAVFQSVRFVGKL